MDCFNHADRHAVSACKSCGRAICRDCAQDLGFAVVCCEACAVDAKQAREMMRRAAMLYGMEGPAQRLPQGTFIWGAFALLFGGWGLFRWWSTGHPDWFLLLFGALCVVFASYAYRRAKTTGINC